LCHQSLADSSADQPHRSPLYLQHLARPRESFANRPPWARRNCPKQPAQRP
jgi:hypothetical protein